ncbi:MAG: prephenate dehydrogenase [Bacteroidota bacterium]
MVVTVVGLGLIGGSLALDLRANGFANSLIGVDQSAQHCQQALDRNLVDKVLPLEQACWESDIILLAIPVGAIVDVLPQVLTRISKQCVVMDMGSTKEEISRLLKGHSRRGRCVLAHPMAGTEYSGPMAAVKNLFQGNAAIICDKEASDPDALKLAERLFKSLFMHLIYMDAASHDIHAAYVSHISHISSFVLSLTVLEKEKSESTIFNLASGGFASTVRLAKSSPKMWRDVYQQNSSNILDVLDEYIEKITLFRELIASGDFDGTQSLMKEANEIRRILDGEEADLPISSSPTTKQQTLISNR